MGKIGEQMWHVLQLMVRLPIASLNRSS